MWMRRGSILKWSLLLANLLLETVVMEHQVLLTLLSVQPPHPVPDPALQKENYSLAMLPLYLNFNPKCSPNAYYYFDLHFTDAASTVHINLPMNPKNDVEEIIENFV